MPTFPATRRTFLDAEVRNESAAIAGLLRSLAQWQNTTYARDLNVTPADPAVYFASGWLFGEPDLVVTPWGRRSSTEGPWNLAEVFLVDPRGPFQSVRFWVYVVLTDSTSTGRVDFLNATSNLLTSLTVNYAALGSSLSGWLSVDVPAAALQTIRVSASWLSGNSLRIDGLSGYWIPPVVAGVTQVPLETLDPSVLSREDGPYSSLLLRHLARAANALWYGRPLQVLSKWWWGYGSGTTADWSSFPRCVGRYRVWVGAHVSGVSIAMKTRASAAGSVTIAIPSLSVSASIAVPAGHGSVTGALSFTAPATGAPYEITVTVDGDPGYIEVRAVTIYESGVTQPFAAPTNFTINEDGAIVSRSSITRALADQLLGNMRWLWTYRRVRTLVSDCRFTKRMFHSFTGIDGTANCEAYHRIAMSRPAVSTAVDQIAPIRIRQGAHATAPGEHVKTYTQAAGGSEAAWAPTVQATQTSAAGPAQSWSPHLQKHWQHRQALKYTATAVAEFSTFQSDLSAMAFTFQAWTILEEMPIDTPFLIGAP